MVSSVNGKITKGDDPNIYSWTSPEDKKLFFSMIKKHYLIVMGSKTYEAVKDNIRLEKNKLRIILTRNVQNYLKEAVSERLEFSDESPKTLIKRLEDKGYRTLLLVGGGQVNTFFLKESLVNEIHLTIEPKIFGEGKGLIGEELLDIPLKLISVKKLNNQGTLHLKYKVQK